jgi:transcriptional regulator with XRE-family HTH domain
MALQYGRSRLPKLLHSKSLSQADFARKIQISEAYLSQIISGKRRFTLIVAINAALILKVSVNDLYEWEEV